MLVLDITILTILYFFIEWKYLGKKYKLFSPYMLFNVFFFSVYLLPYYFHIFDINSELFSSLTSEEITIGYRYIRIFYYLFFALSLFSFRKIKHKWNYEYRKIDSFARDTSLFLYVLTFIVYMISIGVPVGFSPSGIVERLINPRSFTYIRSGYGIINHLYSASKIILLILGLNAFYKNKSFLTGFLLFISIILNILGGSKSSFIYVVLVFTYMSNKYRVKNTRINLRRIILLAVISISMLFVGFKYFYMPGQVLSSKEAINNLVEYQKEAAYTVSVINNFKWKPQYLIEGIYDTLIPFIPRNIWPNKPYSGFYNRYFQPIYNPNAVIYHTSTFGMLSEAHMMFGIIGSFIYPILSIWLLDFIYKKQLTARTLFQSFVPIYLIISLYGYIRAGYLSSNLVAFVFQIITAYIILDFIPNKLRINRLVSKSIIIKN